MIQNYFFKSFFYFFLLIIVEHPRLDERLLIGLLKLDVEPNVLRACKRLVEAAVILEGDVVGIIWHSHSVRFC